MAADSAGVTLTTVVTCEGDLEDPEFVGQFERTLSKLQGILEGPVKVHKLEPWNSVRVTLSIPRDAALRLRQLANDGSQQLRALGILSVQVEGDQVISLRLAGTATTEPQEIILRTGQQDGSSNGPTSSNLSQLLTNANEPVPPPPVPATPTTTPTTTPAEKVQFRSPNVVCPSDSIVPKVPMPAVTSAATPPTTKTYAGPFPFTSMNQAMHSNVATPTNGNTFTAPPPPYPGKHPPVTISSPLLVNLLQNEGATPSTSRPPPDLVDSNRKKIRTFQNVNNVITSVAASPTGLINQAKVLYGNNVLPRQATQIFHQKMKEATGSTTNISAPNNILPTTISNLGLANSIPSNIALPNNTISNVALSNAMNSNVVFSNAMSSALSNAITSNVSLSNAITSNVSLSNAITSNVSLSNVALSNTISNVALSNLPTTISSTSNVLTSSRNPVPYSLYPPPPSYPNSTMRQWEQSVQPMPHLQDLTPLTDLKADLDHLLPSLEMTGSPPEMPEELLNDKGRTVYLINPLTGELEPQSSSDSEEEEFRDVFTGLPSPSNFSDEDTNSTIRPDTTDQSDSESRSGHSDSSKHSKLKGRSREKGRDSPNVGKPTEKIKLRLKLEKSEPVSPAYKVDVSFINTQQPKKAVTVPGEELRVPPLHISLRGRNHAVINNKKKVKLNADGKGKIMQDYNKVKKDGEVQGSEESCDYEARKVKKPKLNYELKDQVVCVSEVPKDGNLYNHMYKEKLKERRGSDSELARNNKKYVETNGVLSEEKKRRLSQSEDNIQSEVLGSTNTGTITSLGAHKVRKEKFKLKENFKNKDLNRFKSYSKNIADKKLEFSKQVSLPTGEIDMEAKFKQRLMEDADRTVININSKLEVDGKVDGLIQTLANPPPVKDKPPEPDKCNTPDRKPSEEKQPNRSPNSGAQGEDSGIESMDALSEKSPNQASQSPHAEITDLPPPKTKTQVPDILDIEAQLAKMEGLHGEDLNENHNNKTKLDQCCGLPSALQDSLSKGTVSLTQHVSQIKKQIPQVEVSLVPLKSKPKEEDLEPLPLRVTPPLFTYSNPEKRGSESPALSDSDSSTCQQPTVPKSLLEQLLIEIPENQTLSSPSPATRSVRTRASSKMNSPELNSPINNKSKTTPTTKRKRHESDSSNHSLEDQRNKKPRTAEVRTKPPAETAASKPANNAAAAAGGNTMKKKILEESSDSDEPLIEVAGKVRKSTQANASAKVKLKGAPVGGVASPGVKNATVNTRRSIRTMPAAVNTRSKGDKSNPDSDVIRRKTRSTVSEGEGKRRKDIK